MPSWTFREFPQQLGNWHGEETRLDPEIAVATGAEVLVNRNYRDTRGHAISMHAAMFKNPAVGITHTPSVLLPDQRVENAQPEFRERSGVE